MSANKIETWRWFDMAETDSRYSESNNQASDHEKILAIFESVGIGSDSRVFDRIVQSVQIQRMIENSLFSGGEFTYTSIAGTPITIKTVPRRVDYFRWVPSENHTNAKRCKAEYGIICFISLTEDERSYSRSATVSLLESAVQDVRIGYSNGMISFEPTFYTKFGIVSEGGKAPPGANFSDIDTNIDYVFSDPFPIPLGIFACWLQGNLEDLSRGIQIEASDNYFLTYEGKKYPIELYRWANGKGLGALDILLGEQLMSRESYDILTKRISSQMEVSGNSSSSTLSENHADIAATPTKEPISFAKGLGDVQPSGYPHGPSLQELPRLAIIGNYDGSVQNYSSWSKLLGYSSKSSVSDFLKKMEGMSVLTLEKTPHGTRINLTPYGKQEVLHWQTNKTS